MVLLVELRLQENRPLDRLLSQVLTSFPLIVCNRNSLDSVCHVALAVVGSTSAVPPRGLHQIAWYLFMCLGTSSLSRVAIRCMNDSTLWHDNKEGQVMRRFLY